MTTSNENPLDSQDKFVYESPDGGQTVYRRRVGKVEREMTEESIRHWEIFIEERKEDTLWSDIRFAAHADPVLSDMLEKIKSYYYLKHKTE